MKKVISIILVVMILIPLVEGSTDEYLSEFNELGQLCHVESQFYYIDSESNIAMATSYSCCDINEICDEIVFDTQNRKEFTKEDLIELYNAFYVRSKIDNNQISPNAFNIKSSKGACEYFGFDVLKQESINLIATVDGKRLKYVSKNTANYLNTAKKYGKPIGLIKTFNPGSFALSIACTGFSKNDEKIALDIAKCKQYFELLKEGNSYFGLNRQMSLCIDKLNNELEEYIESPIMQLKAPVDGIGNTLTGLVNWALNDPVNNPDAKLEIKESNYNVFKSVYTKVSSFNHDIIDNEAQTKADNNINSISQKKIKASLDYQTLRDIYELTRDSLPPFWLIWIKNWFVEPNYELSQVRISLEKIGNGLESMQSNIIYYKLNSAKFRGENISAELNTTNILMNEELNKERRLGL